MYIYNVTINIDEDVYADWLKWMKEKHMPDVMASGCFVDCQILKVLGIEEQGPTYTAQYRFLEMSDIEKYQKEHAPRLQKEHKDRYGEKYTAFRTLLELM